MAFQIKVLSQLQHIDHHPHDVSTTSSRRSGDPLIFDLNRDEKVDIIGGEKGSGGVAMPAGLWEISIKAGANSENRYVINNANQGNGAHGPKG